MPWEMEPSRGNNHCPWLGYHMSGLQLQQVFSLHIFWPLENSDYIFISKTIDLAASQRIRKERSDYLLSEHHSSMWKIKSTKLNMEKSIKRA